MKVVFQDESRKGKPVVRVPLPVVMVTCSSIALCGLCQKTRSSFWTLKNRSGIRRPLNEYSLPLSSLTRQ